MFYILKMPPFSYCHLLDVKAEIKLSKRILILVDAVFF